MNDANSNKRARSDRKKFRSFDVGELVMRKIPGSQSCFDVNNKIVSCQGKSHPKVIHLNHLKKFRDSNNSIHHYC